MKITNKQAIAVLAVALTAAAAGIGSVYAESEAKELGNPMSGLISAIASKFNLDADKIQQVFDDQRAEMEVRRKQNCADRLKKAVAAGELTQAQADAISAKQADMEDLKTEMQGKTAEERRTAMKEQMDSLKQWAKDNSIPSEFMMMGRRGMGGRPGPGIGGQGCPCDKTGGIDSSK